MYWSCAGTGGMAASWAREAYLLVSKETALKLESSCCLLVQDIQS